jgi:hypothetical protein
MKPILKNTLAILSGLIIGSIVNMAIITYGPIIIPPPIGADVTTEEGLKTAMTLFEPKHFIMPFLAHAIGTFVGAFLTYNIAANYKLLLTYILALFFLAGGIYMVFILPSPLWFSAIDLIAAYIPMAYLAIKLNKKRSL